MTETCNYCKVKKGELHVQGCGMEVCPECGLRAADCNCKTDLPRLPFDGYLPGQRECEEFGWFSRFTPEGYVPCAKDEPGAIFDVNRLYSQCLWDKQAQRWVKEEAFTATCEFCGQRMDDGGACTFTHARTAAGELHARIPYGEETPIEKVMKKAGLPFCEEQSALFADLAPKEGDNCTQCGVAFGAFHHDCPKEECPICHNRLLECDCIREVVMG